MAENLHGIAELPTYLSLARKLLTDDERQQVINYLAANPTSGYMMEGTGGIRKLRWRRTGHGKSGGVRIVYFYHGLTMPLYLLTIFAKGDKENLSQAERNELALLARELVNIWKTRNTA